MSSSGRHRSLSLDTVSSPAGDPATRRRILDATLRLVVRRGGADVRMADVARVARVSRQALYLHFADRAELFTAVVRHGDERRGLTAAIRRVTGAASAVDAIRQMVALQAEFNPDIWPVARALEAVRRQDEAAERSWQDRLENRLQGCRGIVARLVQEGTLGKGVDQAVAADLLWTLTSLRTWEDLVLQRGWTAARYEEQITRLLLITLTGGAGSLQPSMSRTSGTTFVP